jgi:hypothetical protein
MASLNVALMVPLSATPVASPRGVVETTVGIVDVPPSAEVPPPLEVPPSVVVPPPLEAPSSEVPPSELPPPDRPAELPQAAAAASKRRKGRLFDRFELTSIVAPFT